MKIVIVAACVLSLSILNAAPTPQDDAFQKIAHVYIEQYLQTNPEQATELGDHRFDGQLTDYSPEAQAKDLVFDVLLQDAKIDIVRAGQL